MQMAYSNFLFFKNIFKKYFKLFPHPMWGFNPGPGDQRSHDLLIEPARQPQRTLLVFGNISLREISRSGINRSKGVDIFQGS